MSELMQGFESCYTPRPTAMKTHEVYNFQRWLGVNSIKNHSKPHVFKIIMNKVTQKAEVHYKGLSTDKDWIKPEGNGSLLEEGNRALVTIPSSTDNIDIERLRTDLKLVCSYYKADDLKTKWDTYINELLEDEELESRTEDLIAALKGKKGNQLQGTPDVEIEMTDILEGLPILKPDIPKVIIGRQERTAGTSKTVQSQEGYLSGSFVICNFDKYPDEFPQVAQIVSVGETHLELLWFKGAKTTTWKPASRPVKGQRGQREPWKELVPLSAVWLSDFHLTPNGKLPQHIKDMLDQV